MKIENFSGTDILKLMEKGLVCVKQGKDEDSLGLEFVKPEADITGNSDDKKMLEDFALQVNDGANIQDIIFEKLNSINIFDLIKNGFLKVAKDSAETEDKQ